jgi:hypothetical protein
MSGPTKNSSIEILSGRTPGGQIHGRRWLFLVIPWIYLSNNFLIGLVLYSAESNIAFHDLCAMMPTMSRFQFPTISQLDLYFSCFYPVFEYQNKTRYVGAPAQLVLQFQTLNENIISTRQYQITMVLRITEMASVQKRSWIFKR